jgi:uncharacterized protein YcgI (DUF1989 family)
MMESSHPMPPFPYEFFEEVRSSRASFHRVKQYVIPLTERGKAFVVKKGQAVRIICVEGPQVVDVCIWNADNYEEYFWNEFTLSREGLFLTTFSRLWSNMPKLRPMMTIIEDTVETQATFPGAGHHYCFGGHCNPHFWYWALKDKTHPYVTTFSCYHNLLRAVTPFGLGPLSLHDNINLFQKTHFELDTGRRPVESSDAKAGDYVEFFAEMDVLMAVSICPGGSFAENWSAGENEIKPIGIEIYDTGIQPLKFEDVLGV